MNNDDVTAAALVFLEEGIRRKKAEITALNALEENKKLAARVSELEKAQETKDG